MLTKTDIAQILMKERRQLSAYIIAVTREVQSAEDLYQDVCLKAMTTSEVFLDSESLLRWSRVTARYTAIDVLRSRLRSSVPLGSDVLELLAAEWPTHAQEEGSERIDAMIECIKQLSSYNHEIVQLRYQEGLTGTEVASRMGRRARTIYQALTRIHEQLRSCVARRLSGSLTT